jgi:hypothetical protein
MGTADMNPRLQTPPRPGLDFPPKLPLRPLWLAVHEAAHAVAGLVLDEMPPYPGPHLRSVSLHPEDEQLLGFCRRDLRVIPEWNLPSDKQPEELRGIMIQQARLDMVAVLAGSMAEARHRHSWFGIAMLKGGWTSEILGESLEGIHDAARIQRSLQWLAPADPIAELGAIWNTTLRLLETEWPGILGIAKVLRCEREMDGETFEERWRILRPSEAVRARRMKRFPSEQPILTTPPA